MDRNTENRYGIVDEITKPRSTYNSEFTHKTSFNNGELIPFYINMDIIPGTTIKNRTSFVLRMTTPLNPAMDNLYADTYWFRCSKFWYWEHWRAMMGENNYGAWAQTIEYTEPKVSLKTTNYTYGPHDLANYIGVRQGTGNLEYSKIAINAYIDIWNQWFRDQNLQAPIQFDTTDANLTADNTINTGFGILPVQKFHDYFTSCLPEPQKGAPITMPLGTSAPVYTGADNTNLPTTANALRWKPAGTYTLPTSNNIDLYASTDSNGIAFTRTGPAGFSPGAGTAPVQPSNLYTDLTQATAASINALRLAFATQRILERDSMCGTRYREILRAHFGATPADESLMTPEYLGGHRIPINIETVLQNSSTDSTSPLGYTGATSITLDVNEDFTKTFMKDDILIGLICVRCDHTYQQGLPRQLTRDRKLDRYWPELAHIGNQPVYNEEIFATGTSTDKQVFGYKEAWQEYLYKNNRISGELNSDYAQSLDVWHYGDDYATLPVLSDNWIREPQEYLDRTLAIASTSQNQFIADFLVEQIVSAPIPIHRVPGLIDHY